MSDDRANQLIRDYKNGIITKDEAFDQIEPLVRRKVHRALRFGGDFAIGHEDADDLYQDVMVAFYESLDIRESYDPERDVYGYLYIMARNRKLDLIRTNRGRFTVVIDERVASRGWDDVFDSKIIADTLRELHPEEFELLLLKQEEQLTMEDLANIRQEPLSTIKYRLLIAREKLRKALCEKPATVAWEGSK